MAEQENNSFEHEFERQFKMLDENIKIPEIPDAQRIFELAEKKETKVFSFAKYKKIAGIAAAVVLICVSIPILSRAAGFNVSMDFAANEAVLEPGEAPQATMDEAVRDYSDMFDYCEYSETEADAEASLGKEADDGEARMDPLKQEEDGVLPENMPEEQKAVSGNGKNEEYSEIKYALNNFFTTNSMTESVPIAGDSVSSMGGELNKKRSIELTVENDSVSVMLYDISAGNEVISAFWVEGVYQNSGLEGEKYVLNTEKAVSLDDINNGYYLPMIGDAKNGTYFIEEQTIVIPEKIVKGTIALCVKIDIGTGEYEVSASIL